MRIALATVNCFILANDLFLQGMSEAERKLEALTQQIEAEMEKREQEGDYYGKLFQHSAADILGVCSSRDISLDVYFFY